MNSSSPKPPNWTDYASVFGCVAVIITALAWGMFGKNPYGFYVFLRIVVCFGCIVFAALAAGHDRDNLSLIFWLVLILYNPLIPIHMTRHSWGFFNAATIALFVSALIVWMSDVRKAAGREKPSSESGPGP